jgi:hypothetical protein
MIRPNLALAILLAALPALAQRDPLPVPLKLPPGNIQLLYIDRDASYMGDTVRIPDCPKKEDLPLGTCGNVLFGGPALWNTHLFGPLVIKFYDPRNNISHFEISHPFNLTSGDDVVMSAPQLYSYVIKDTRFIDPLNEVSTGDLNLQTGEVTNLVYKGIFANNWYNDLVSVNPKLKPPVVTFPGQYGSAEAEFEQRPDGLLDFTFYGTTFLPLGGNTQGDPMRLPLPFCGPLVQCGSIQASGLSLHPHIRLSTKGENHPPCGDTCMPIVPNSVLEFTLNPRFTSIGDDFGLNIGELGGLGIGRSEMMGRVAIQFGSRSGKFIPVTLRSLPPAALLVPPPPFPLAGLSLGFIGFDENLVFPKNVIYRVQSVATTDDPFDIPVGEVNLETGYMVGGMLWRTFWTTSLLNAILVHNNGRIPPQSFLLRGPAWFQTGPNGQMFFRYDATEYRPFAGFTFPGNNIDYADTSRDFTAGLGSLLTPFFKIQATLPVDTPTAVISGAQTNVRSSFNEMFSYSYSIPCDPTGKTGTFEYTNLSAGSNGGTFKMENLGSVQCMNSLNSRLPRGSYDTVNFTGFGTWSKDDGPHVATVSFSVAPDAPFIAIQIDGGTLSNVDTKPPDKPEP